MVIRRIEGNSSIFDCFSVSSDNHSGSSSNSSVRNGMCSVGVMYSYYISCDSDYIGSSG